MGWFKDLFINEAKSALSSESCQCNSANNVLVDRVTGKAYEIYVSNGKLTMSEVK